MPTEAIIKALCAIEEAPWGDLKGKPIDARGLAQRLRPYGVTSKNLRDGSGVVKGYARSDLLDAWQRYLSEPLRDAASSATTATTPPVCSGVADVAVSPRRRTRLPEH